MYIDLIRRTTYHISNTDNIFLHKLKNREFSINMAKYNDYDWDELPAGKKIPTIAITNHVSKRSVYRTS